MEGGIGASTSSRIKRFLIHAAHSSRQDDRLLSNFNDWVFNDSKLFFFARARVPVCHAAHHTSLIKIHSKHNITSPSASEQAGERPHLHALEFLFYYWVAVSLLRYLERIHRANVYARRDKRTIMYAAAVAAAAAGAVTCVVRFSTVPTYYSLTKCIKNLIDFDSSCSTFVSLGRDIGRIEGATRKESYHRARTVFYSAHIDTAIARRQSITPSPNCDNRFAVWWRWYHNEWCCRAAIGSR